MPASDEGLPKCCPHCGFRWIGAWPCPNKRKPECLGFTIAELAARWGRRQRADESDADFRDRVWKSGPRRYVLRWEP